MSTEEELAQTPAAEEAPPSVRDALEAAITTHADGAEVPAAEVGGVAGLLAEGAAPAKDAPPAHAAPVDGSTAPAAALNAPASWKAGLREHWKTLAPDVQQEIHRREGEQAERMRENAGYRQQMERFQQTVEPYRAIIEAEGGNPIAAFNDYLKAATLLRTAPPADKAAFVAGIVQRYGIPLDALDAHLAQAIQRGPIAQPQQQYPMQQQPMQPQQFRDPRLDALLAQAEQAQAGQIRSEVESFKADGKHEFFDDVRGTMADVMDAAAKRGINMSMEDAYQRAIQIEPEVRKVMEQRGMRQNASQAARTLAAARHASSSLPSGLAPPAARLATLNGSGPLSVRQSLDAAIDTLRTDA
jgi:hypothetical protein